MVWRVAPKKASRPVAWLIVAFILYVCMLCRFIATRTKIAILPRAVTDARVRRPRALGFRRLRCQTRVDPPETAPSSMRNDGSGELPPSCGRTPKKIRAYVPTGHKKGEAMRSTSGSFAPSRTFATTRSVCKLSIRCRENFSLQTHEILRLYRAVVRARMPYFNRIRKNARSHFLFYFCSILPPSIRCVFKAFLVASSARLYHARSDVTVSITRVPANSSRAEDDARFPQTWKAGQNFVAARSLHCLYVRLLGAHLHT